MAKSQEQEQAQEEEQEQEQDQDPQRRAAKVMQISLRLASVIGSRMGAVRERERAVGGDE